MVICVLVDIQTKKVAIASEQCDDLQVDMNALKCLKRRIVSYVLLACCIEDGT